MAAFISKPFKMRGCLHRHAGGSEPVRLQGIQEPPQLPKRILMLAKVSSEPLVLVSVITCGLLGVFTRWLPRIRPVAARFIW
jgi:hypothetical protein